MAVKVKWSKSYPLDAEGKGIEKAKRVEKGLRKGGVFEIRQNKFYSRFKGKTRVLNIGQSESEIGAEIKHRLTIHTTANRIKGILKKSRGKEFKLTFRFSVKKNPGESEKQLLKAFEREHWDLPALNSQRGYVKRGKDIWFARHKP